MSPILQLPYPNITFTPPPPNTELKLSYSATVAIALGSGVFLFILLALLIHKTWTHGPKHMFKRSVNPLVLIFSWPYHVFRLCRWIVGGVRGLFKGKKIGDEEAQVEMAQVDEEQHEDANFEIGDGEDEEVHELWVVSPTPMLDEGTQVLAHVGAQAASIALPNSPVPAELSVVAEPKEKVWFVQK